MLDHVISADESEPIEIAIKTMDWAGKSQICSTMGTRRPSTKQSKASALGTMENLMPPYYWIS